jgi:hypothetical protein
VQSASSIAFGHFKKDAKQCQAWRNFGRAAMQISVIVWLTVKDVSLL